MINLIPNEEKKVMFRDFYLRLIIVVFTMLAASITIGIFAIAPSYSSLYFDGNLVKDALKIQEEEPVSISDQNTLVKVKELEDKLALIEKAKENKYNLSDRIINEIVLKKSSSIKITEITYKSSSPRGREVSIVGIAPSREALLLFRKSFEDNPAFKEVDLPISNFIKGSNIRFYITLIPS